jgi:hypothetical protein
MLGAGGNVKLVSLTHFKHNYNHVSRAAMYAWFNKHLKLGHSEPILEEDYPRLTERELTVWDDGHPKPAGGPQFERELLRHWTNDTRLQLDDATPKDAASFRTYREVVGGGIDAVIGRTMPAGADLEFEQTGKRDRGAYVEVVGLLRNKPVQEELPMLFLHPNRWEGHVAIWIDAKGKSAVYGDDDQPVNEIQRLLDAGMSIAAVDLLFQGEFLNDGIPEPKTRRVKNPREAAAYTFGYNDSLFASRVRDILTALAFVQNHEDQPKAIHLIGFGKAGPLVAAARAQARDAVTAAVIDTNGFRFKSVDDIHSPDFLPGGAKYDDLPGMMAVAAPSKTWLAGEGGKAPQIVSAAYQAAQASENLTTFDGDTKEMQTAIDWLLQQGK